MKYVIERLGDCEVHDELVASTHRFATVVDERPLRIGTKHVAVFVHALWFDPDPEIHPERLHVLDEWSQAMRIHLWRHDPVAESALVVASRTEPAVVENETFDADPRCAASQFEEHVWIVVEIDRLPGVQHHLAW